MKGMNVVDPKQIAATMQCAVADSATVIVCLCQKYKEDPDCQRMCLYASNKQRKHVIPVLVEPGYMYAHLYVHTSWLYLDTAHDCVIH